MTRAPRIDVREALRGDVHAVLGDLDQHDKAEAEAMGWQPFNPRLVAESMLKQQRLGGRIFVASDLDLHGGILDERFALFGFGAAESGGTARAGFLARNHRLWARPLLLLGAAVRSQIDAYARLAGLRRLEVRLSAEHPTAAKLCLALGFEFETDLPGFGIPGARFEQWARVIPARQED